jgi:hypothetical protein
MSGAGAARWDTPAGIPVGYQGFSKALLSKRLLRIQSNPCLVLEVLMFLKYYEQDKRT